MSFLPFIICHKGLFVMWHVLGCPNINIPSIKMALTRFSLTLSCAIAILCMVAIISPMHVMGKVLESGFLEGLGHLGHLFRFQLQFPWPCSNSTNSPFLYLSSSRLLSLYNSHRESLEVPPLSSAKHSKWDLSFLASPSFRSSSSTLSMALLLRLPLPPPPPFPLGEEWY